MNVTNVKLEQFYKMALPKSGNNVKSCAAIASAVAVRNIWLLLANKVLISL